MAASVVNGNLFVCAEFVSLLKVANVYVHLDSTIAAAIRQVVFSADEVKVFVNEGVFSHLSKDVAAILKWPPSIRLLPDTCSKLSCMSHALTFRCQYEEQAGDDQTNHVQGRRTFERIVCRVCGNDFKIDSSTITIRRVPVSCLGLPPGLSWENMSMSYFCHDHGHEEDGEQEQMATTFGPQVAEYFDCDTYVVFNNEQLNHDRMSVSKSTGIVNCARCHKRIGRSVNVHGDLYGLTNDANQRWPLIKLYSDAVGCSIDDESCDELFIFAEILKSSDVICRRLCFVVDDEGDEVDQRRMAALLVTIMDRNLKTVKASSFSESVGRLKTVWKLLYKVEHDSGDNSLVLGQWLADATVRVVRVHRHLLDKFGVVLTRGTRELPMAWRYADDFCVSYIPHADSY